MRRRSRGEKLYELREQSGMSLRELAEIVGVHRSTLWRYENDEIVNWNPEVVKKLCQHFHVTPDSLQEDDVQPFNYELWIHRILSGESVRGVSMQGEGHSPLDELFRKLNERQKLRYLLMLKLMEQYGQLDAEEGMDPESPYDWLAEEEMMEDGDQSESEDPLEEKMMPKDDNLSASGDPLEEKMMLKDGDRPES